MTAIGKPIKKGVAVPVKIPVPERPQPVKEPVKVGVLVLILLLAVGCARSPTPVPTFTPTPSPTPTPTVVPFVPVPTPTFTPVLVLTPTFTPTPVPTPTPTPTLTPTPTSVPVLTSTYTPIPTPTSTPTPTCTPTPTSSPTPTPTYTYGDYINCRIDRDTAVRYFGEEEVRKWDEFAARNCGYIIPYYTPTPTRTPAPTLTPTPSICEVIYTFGVGPAADAVNFLRVSSRWDAARERVGAEVRESSQYLKVGSSWSDLEGVYYVERSVVVFAIPPIQEGFEVVGVSLVLEESPLYLSDGRDDFWLVVKSFGAVDGLEVVESDFGMMTYLPNVGSVHYTGIRLNGVTRLELSPLTVQGNYVKLMLVTDRDVYDRVPSGWNYITFVLESLRLELTLRFRYLCP